VQRRSSGWLNGAASGPRCDKEGAIGTARHQLRAATCPFLSPVLSPGDVRQVLLVRRSDRVPGAYIFYLGLIIHPPGAIDWKTSSRR
jgi:hypothetical protein